MGRTTIQVSDELADELHGRKNRGDSYEDVIWRVIDAAERQTPAHPGGPDDLAPGEDPPEVRLSDDQREMLRDRLAGSGSALMARVYAVEAMYRELRRLGEAEKSDLLEVVDVDATAYQSERSVWSNVVKGQDTLSALPGVEAPATGMSTWRHARGDRQ